MRWFIGFIFCILHTSIHASQALLPFQARYTVFYRSIELGQAHYELTKIKPNHFIIDFNSHLSFLWLWNKRNINCYFYNSKNKLNDIKFIHKREGTGREFLEETLFNYRTKKIATEYKNKKVSLNFSPEIQDPLLSQLQMRIDLFRFPRGC